MSNMIPTPTSLPNVRVSRSALLHFCTELFTRLGLSPADAAVAADVLVAADARGIPSHGVARLPSYVNGITTGATVPAAQPEVIAETAATLAVDAHGGMGAPASAEAMRRIIAKAHTSGAAIACVRDSNHFGIAGYYAMLALEHDMIGLAMTNTAALGVPTFGRQVMYGTNPIAFAAPAGRERAFVLDMSTTVVTKGKLEVYERLGQPLPDGWAVDRSGHSARDPHRILDEMFQRVGGGMLPLGGEGELHSGYKGYGLAVMVDILCGVLGAAAFGPGLADNPTCFGRVSHFFAAFNVAAFRDVAGFKADMDQMLSDLRASPLAEGTERIYVAGEKEFEREAEYARDGVPLLRQTYDRAIEIGKLYGVERPEAVR